MRHPILANKSRFITWWLAWAIVAAGQSLLIHFVYGNDLNISIIDGVVSAVIYGLLGLVIWFPLRYILRDNINMLSTAGNILLTGSVIVIAWILLSRLIVRAVAPVREDYDLFWHSVAVFRITAGILMYFLIILIYHLYLSANRLAEKVTRQAQLEAMVREGELKMLRSQINPHFLFNSLNSISSLTLTDPLKAREMIVKLSEFMRYSLSSRNDLPVTLQTEMESLRLYLEIEKIRFGDRLVIEEKIAGEALPAIMPGMLLQPLYENAVKHGVYESTETVTINTSVRREERYVIITVSNNTDPEAVVTRKGTGIGIKNVRSRLELFFGEEAGLAVNRGENSFNVTLKFPFKKS